MEGPVSRAEHAQHTSEVYRRMGSVEGKLDALETSFTKHQLEYSRESGAAEEWRKGIDRKIDQWGKGIMTRLDLDKEDNERRFSASDTRHKQIIAWIIGGSGFAAIIGRLLELFSG